MTGDREPIFPVLLSGGAGSRLWPLAREATPKQLLPLIGEGTLLQQTALRATDPGLFEPLTVIAGAEHRFAIAEQLRESGVAARIVLEPTPRNTAAAAATAALFVERSRPDGLMLLMPADHLIGDVKGFRRTVSAAADVAGDGYLVLFGVTPDTAATGYGYIRVGKALAADGPARRVGAFVEKPDRDTAKAYVESGEYLWNSGIFLMPAALLLAELRAYEPELVEAATEALQRASSDADFLRLEPTAFSRCRSVSIDHAVMERTGKAAVVPAEFSWADVGSWSTLWSLAERDDAENAVIGDVRTWMTRGSYVRSEGPLVATVGVDDLIVVATPDAVLVAGKAHDQDIRKIVEQLRHSDPKRA